MVTKSQIQDTKRDWSECCYCGITGQPLTAKDLPKPGPGGYAWRLAACCLDTHGCGQRIRQRDAHMDERFTLTAKGYAVVEATDPTIHSTGQPGRYVVDSGTVKGVRYGLEVLPDSRVACTCRGWEFHGHCKHSDQLARILSGRATLRGAA